jgi:secreted PhoX family phosphatase
MIEKGGRVFVLAGNGDPVDKDGTGLEASFNGPQGITRDSQGNLYVTTYNYDTKGGNKVRKIVLR